MPGGVLAEVVEAGTKALRQSLRGQGGQAQAPQVMDLADICQAGLAVCRKRWDKLAEDVATARLELGPLRERCHDLAHVAEAFRSLAQAAQELLTGEEPRLREGLTLLAEDLAWFRDKATLLLEGITRSDSDLEAMLRLCFPIPMTGSLEPATPHAVRVPPLAYLRTVALVAWSALRHPFSTTTIDLLTGRIISRVP